MIPIFSLGQEPVKITKRSLQRKVSDEVSKKHASKKRELTQIRCFSHHYLDEKSIIFSLRCYWCLIVTENLIKIPKQGYLCSD